MVSEVGLDHARRLRHRRGRQGDTWHLDKLFVKIQGRQQYLWRAVDEDGDVLDIRVPSRRNRRAARRFFRKLLKRQGREPRRLITDKLRSYSAAHRTVMPSVIHSTRQYENNRAEVSHQPTRQRERQMRRFKSAAHLQRFASVHGVVENLFRVGPTILLKLNDSWDITKLKGPIPYLYYSLYVILDLFSRYVVGWMVALHENAHLAARLIEQTCAKQGIGPHQLTIHADRGAPMRSKLVALLFSDLGIDASQSRPRVSNDNPFSEAQFRTLK